MGGGERLPVVSAMKALCVFRDGDPGAATPPSEPGVNDGPKTDSSESELGCRTSVDAGGSI